MGQCPSKYHPPGAGFGCVYECPKEKGFEDVVVNGQNRCAYSSEPDKYFVNLKVVQGVQGSQQKPVPDPLTVESLKDFNQTLYGAYTAESSRVEQELAMMYGKIDKETLVNNAFQKLQDAENVRDQAPDAYEAARVGYYTLVKGDSWKQDEANRIANSEAGPVLQNYQSQLQTIQEQQQSQQRTIDIITGVKDKVLSLKDDMKQSTDAFQKQIDTLKNQIQIERHKTVETESVVYTLLDAALNMLLGALLLALIVVTYRKFFQSQQPQVYNPVASLFQSTS